ncbi:Single myb histone 3 [Nymphaea thermarum]|nr:Single myb histone 3 [Nymphaea thermarum]
MGAPKQKWTSEEEEALRAGVDKHGPGKWRTIQKDPEFGRWLSARSNIDLKDKWRNMSVSASGHGSREKSRTPKLKLNPSIPSSSITVNVKAPAPSTTKVADSKSLNDGKNSATRYSAMIIEALSAIRDPNGTDIGAIACFIEQRHEVPSNFRRLLGPKLRRLAGQEKIEKVHNGYRLTSSSLGMRTPTPRQTDPHRRAKLQQSLGSSGSEVKETAISIAYKIADAETKSLLAYRAIVEAERVQRLAEKTDAMLQLAKEFYEQCSRGKVVVMA